MKEYILIKKNTAWGCCMAAAAAMASLAVWWWSPFSPSPEPAEKTETMSYNLLKADGRNILYFRSVSSDSMLIGASLIYGTVKYGQPLSLSSADLHRIVSRSKERLKARKQSLAAVRAELKYYLDIHTVQEEGFGMVAGHDERTAGEMEAAGRLLKALEGIKEDTRLEVVRKAKYGGDGAADSGQPIFVESNGGVWTRGHWLKTRRAGRGIGTDSRGRLVCGIWRSDTLRKGRWTDAEGTYEGEFNSRRLADGHGRYVRTADGTYTEGRWQDGRQSGFGFEVSGSHIRAGEWKGGAYRGERINYTSERIYGIDISRYQHGKGRKYYHIHWNRLRITHLGSISKKQVSGTVDYPVSFVYIKSTEGTTVRNPYYAADYRQARRHGLRCGAYHFLSTKSGAAAQARYFIRHTSFRRGDFPPVLDVEPTHSQITAMGGAEALLHAIRTWMTIVRRHTGVRPVLYVNQTFVNKYLGQAPDIKRDYNVWIARYGEYKPDVKLVYWQLCPDGRVAGIHGDVDINVFNGYQDKFDTFLRTERIK